MRLSIRTAALACCVLIGGGLAAPVAATVAQSAPAGHAAPVIVNRALLTGPKLASVNTSWSASDWSGYAESGTYSGVSSTWTVPTVAASASPTYSSTWIGVDGFTNSRLIQVGTEQDYYGGTAHYNAWWEILPAPESVLTTVTYPVSPGNRMKASIYENAATTTVTSGTTSTVEHLWDIVITDVTKGWTFTTVQAYNGPGTSAEWIHEAPLVNGAVSTLARYTVAAPTATGDFDNAGVRHGILATGGSAVFGGAGLNYGLDAGAMVQKNVVVSTPSGVDAALTAFNVAYGAAMPAKPVG
jgi:hypothetical protein